MQAQIYMSNHDFKKPHYYLGRTYFACRERKKNAFIISGEENVKLD
jgi:hypothetical protein